MNIQIIAVVYKLERQVDNKGLTSGWKSTDLETFDKGSVLKRRHAAMDRRDELTSMYRTMDRRYACETRQI